MDRELLLQQLNTVKAALSSHDFIPVMTHFCFQDGKVFAFNGNMAIETECDLEMEAAIPGSVFLQLLSSISAEELEIKQQKDTVYLAADKSEFELNTIGADHFTYEVPKDDPIASIKLDGNFLNILNKCLDSVGNDPTQPQTQGITMYVNKKTAHLFSTDNIALSRGEAKVKIEGSLEDCVVLPASMCRELISITDIEGNENVVLEIGEDFVYVDIAEKTSIFCKTIEVEDPFPFEDIFAGMCEDPAKLKNQEVPKELSAILKRAKTMLESESDKVVNVSVNGDRVVIGVDSALGQSEETLDFDNEFTVDGDFTVDPVITGKALKSCNKMDFLDEAIAFSSGASYIQLVTHSTED